MRSVVWGTVRSHAMSRLRDAGAAATPVEETRFTRHAADDTVPVEERLVVALWLASYRAAYGFEAAGQGRPGWRAAARVLPAPESTVAVERGDQLALFAPAVPSPRRGRDRATRAVASVEVAPQLALF